MSKVVTLTETLACRVRKQQELEELSQRMRALQDDNTSLRGHVETRNTEILRLRGIIQDMHQAEESPQGLQMANSRRSSEAGGSLEVCGAASLFHGAMCCVTGVLMIDRATPQPQSGSCHLHVLLPETMRLPSL